MCGIGSNHANTRDMIRVLHSVTDQLKKILNKETIRLLDSSCGDMFWIPEFLAARPDVAYTGYDLTETNILANREKHPQFTFKVNLLHTREGVECSLPLINACFPATRPGDGQDPGAV